MAFDDSQDNYLHLCLIFYELSGLRATSKPFLKILSLYVFYPVMMIIFAMMFYNIRYQHANVIETADVFASISIFASIWIRKTILIKHRLIIEDIIEKHSNFWSYDLFGKTTELKLRKYMRFCVLLTKLFLLSVISSIIGHSVSPIFGDDILPQRCWIPGNSHLAKNIIYTLEIVFYMECLTYVPVFEGLYIVVTGNIKSQLILIQKALEFLSFKKEDEEMTWAKLKKLSQHHKLLLSVHKNLNKIYSNFFLLTYINTIILTCKPFIYIHNNNTPEMSEIIKSVLIAIVLNVALIMECIPGSELEIEAENLVTQIYNIKWYETKSLRIRKFIFFWLMQAQVPVQITGGGMLIINRAFILHIQRIAYSLSTILGGMASQTNN